uniref:ATP synthase subunit a n=1 Tax=Ettchellsia sinica TaxID=1738633 RepID=A0A2S0AYQ9_9HYME|nr:ATP synthase FO subunit 6 [Ettchellsia sinica]
MMMNLFDIFDPSVSMMFSLNWFSMILFMLIMPVSFWLIPSLYLYMYIELVEFMYKEFKDLMSKFNLFNYLFFMVLFLYILMNNMIGLFPYVFTASSHLSFSMSLSLPLWLSFMLFGLINNLNYMFMHLLPLGTPKILMPFMVLIESISNLIRPLTLCVRLSANIIAGHLIITLISNLGWNLDLFKLMIIYFIQIMLFMLELGVSLIQSYVFMVLSSLYSKEVN